MWSPDLPAVLSELRNKPARNCYFQSRGLDVAFRRHASAPAWLDTGNRFSALPLGRIQRIDDDVSDGTRLFRASPAAGNLERVEGTTFEYAGLRYIGSFAPLFVHQYSQAWFDFRGKRDLHADYFRNSVIATDVHRRFCLELGTQYPQYSEDLWGITASDSDRGYVVWGGHPAIGPIDGTVVPSAAGGSIPFLTQGTMRILRTIKNRYGERA